MEWESFRFELGVGTFLMKPVRLLQPCLSAQFGELCQCSGIGKRATILGTMEVPELPQIGLVAYNDCDIAVCPALEEIAKLRLCLRICWAEVWSLHL